MSKVAKEDKAAKKAAKKTARIIKDINKPPKGKAGKQAAKSGKDATEARNSRMESTIRRTDPTSDGKGKKLTVMQSKNGKIDPKKPW